MDAKVETHDDIRIIHVSGQLLFERVGLFRQSCRPPVLGEKVIFNLAQVVFVGSSGVTSFVELIGDLANAGLSIRLCQLGSELLKIFAAYPVAGVQIYRTQEEAILSFHPKLGEPVPLPIVFSFSDENEPVLASGEVSPLEGGI